MHPALIVGIVCAAVILLFVFLLVPRVPGKKKYPFCGLNFAHRGLYDSDGPIPENSLPAFLKAAENGYGMELDVQLSRDGKVVVFHDDTLERVCGVKKRVDELDYEELVKLRLCGTDERIPLFEEVLNAVGGRTPIIVELKNGGRNEELCLKTLEFLRGYDGKACIESFNPMIVAWFRKHAPEVFRGQLAQPPRLYSGEGVSGPTGFLLGNTLLNFLARPHFIAYRIGKKPPAVRIAELLGAVKIGWTSRAPENESAFDSLIFEHYLPDPVFKKRRDRR